MRIENFSWGHMQWLADAQTGNAGELSLARMVILAEQIGPWHCHDNCEEVIQVLCGEVCCDCGTERHILNAGAVQVIPRGCAHRLQNTRVEPAELLLCYSSARRAYAPVNAPGANLQSDDS